MRKAKLIGKCPIINDIFFMIKLIQYPRAKNFPNFSPFCVKLETYLKMAQIPYEIQFSYDIKKFPRHKLPLIQDEGKVITDSSFVIEHLREKFSASVDDDLNEDQLAMAEVIQRTIEDHLVPLLMMWRWSDEKSWDVWREQVFELMPRWVKALVPPLLHKKMKKRLWLHGVGRYSKEERLAKVDSSLSALSRLLGEQEFIFGAEPCTTDAVIFAAVGNIYYDPSLEEAAELLEKYPNLVEHTHRMLEKYYPEYLR